MEQAPTHAPSSHSPVYEAGGSDPDFYLPCPKDGAASGISRVLRNLSSLPARLRGSR
ncbi:hypothetical protein [Arthrobacter sp. USHLN218]|uniref:hypothetical protein n=1 Tax=Arthrobacter sp. USHLN218 TaxID=3081232 RepID=UPI0030174A77